MLSGKNIIVTGAAGGIGRHIVAQAVQNGAFVWACCRQEREGDREFFDAFGDAVAVVYFDLANSDATAEAIKEIIHQKKIIHGLVNNAAMVSPNCLFSMTPMKTIRAVFEVNFFSQILIAQLVVRGMMRSPQVDHSIVNIASIAALDGDPGQLEYVASKAAIVGMTKKLARELTPCRIRVNAVAPGVTRTKMIADMREDFMNAALATGINRQPGNPEDVAKIVSFLLSDLSKRINGQVIRADG